MGKALSKEHREKIARSVSETRRRHFLEAVKQRAGEPTEKRCPRCGITKAVAEFGVRKDRRKAGVIAIAPRSECLACEAKRAKQFKERKKAEGTWHEYEARKEAGRDPAKKRQYQREYATIRRRKRGIKPMNRVGKHVVERRDSRDVPVEPASVLLEVLEAQGYTREEISIRSGVEVRRLFDIANQASSSTCIDNVDRLLIAFDRQDDLNDLYPPEEEEAVVGYGILDPDGLLSA